MGKHSAPDEIDWLDELLSKRKPERSDDGNCYGFEDGMDGFVIHGDTCPDAGQSWISSSRCINYSTWRGYWPAWAKER